jgi:hypothetical protein
MHLDLAKSPFVALYRGKTEFWDKRVPCRTIGVFV